MAILAATAKRRAMEKGGKAEPQAAKGVPMKRPAALLCKIWK